MSSNLRIIKICEICKQEFIAEEDYPPDWLFDAVSFYQACSDSVVPHPGGEFLLLAPIVIPTYSLKIRKPNILTRSYVSLVKAAQQVGYKVTLLFIWLDSPETAIQRVADRVAEGGHNIPENVIERRYYRGISNLINLYKPVCDSWIVVNNKNVVPELVA